MKNWKLVAEAMEVPLSEADLKKIVPAMEALEASFRPQAASIPYQAEPAVCFEPEEEEAL